MLIHHTDCGMLTFTDEDLLGAIERHRVRPPWNCETFTDLEEDVRASRRRIMDSPSSNTQLNS